MTRNLGNHGSRLIGVFLLAAAGCTQPPPSPIGDSGGTNTWVFDDTPPGIPPACEDGCAGATPFCGPAQLCVGCTRDSHCGVDRPACETGDGVCVECVADVHCFGAKPICDSATHSCVATCVQDDECTGELTMCEVSSGRCVQCSADADCATDEVCDATGECVGCEEIGLCPPDLGCDTDADCPPDVPTCAVDEDCDDCEDQRICVECVDDDDCLAGFECSDQRCTAQ